MDRVPRSIANLEIGCTREEKDSQDYITIHKFIIEAQLSINIVAHGTVEVHDCDESIKVCFTSRDVSQGTLCKNISFAKERRMNGKNNVPLQNIESLYDVRMWSYRRIVSSQPTHSIGEWSRSCGIKRWARTIETLQLSKHNVTQRREECFGGRLDAESQRIDWEKSIGYQVEDDKEEATHVSFSFTSNEPLKVLFAW